MNNTQFSEKLLETTLLLVALYTFNALMVLAAPFFGLGTNLLLFVRHSNWIGQLGFGLIIYNKLKEDKSALSIGLLAFCVPVFGGLFYLLIVSFRPSTT